MKKALLVVAFLLVCSQAFAAFSIVESQDKFDRTVYILSDSMIGTGIDSYNAIRVDSLTFARGAKIIINATIGILTETMFIENKNIPQVVRQLKNTPAYDKNALRIGSEPEIVEESLLYDTYMALIDKETVYGALASVLQS